MVHIISILLETWLPKYVIYSELIQALILHSIIFLVTLFSLLFTRIRLSWFSWKTLSPELLWGLKDTQRNSLSELSERVYHCPFTWQPMKTHSSSLKAVCSNCGVRTAVLLQKGRARKRYVYDGTTITKVDEVKKLCPACDVYQRIPLALMMTWFGGLLIPLLLLTLPNKTSSIAVVIINVGTLVISIAAVVSLPHLTVLPYVFQYSSRYKWDTELNIRRNKIKDDRKLLGEMSTKFGNAFLSQMTLNENVIWSYAPSNKFMLMSSGQHLISLAVSILGCVIALSAFDEISLLIQVLYTFGILLITIPILYVFLAYSTSQRYLITDRRVMMAVKYVTHIEVFTVSRYQLALATGDGENIRIKEGRVLWDDVIDPEEVSERKDYLTLNHPQSSNEYEKRNVEGEYVGGDSELPIVSFRGFYHVENPEYVVSLLKSLIYARKQKNPNYPVKALRNPNPIIKNDPTKSLMRKLSNLSTSPDLLFSRKSYDSSFSLSDTDDSQSDLDDESPKEKIGKTVFLLVLLQSIVPIAIGYIIFAWTRFSNRFSIAGIWLPFLVAIIIGRYYVIIQKSYQKALLSFADFPLPEKIEGPFIQYKEHFKRLSSYLRIIKLSSQIFRWTFSIVSTLLVTFFFFSYFTGNISDTKFFVAIIGSLVGRLSVWLLSFFSHKSLE